MIAISHPSTGQNGTFHRRPAMEKLSGKTALVTGSTDGVGRLVARKLGQAGARVRLRTVTTALTRASRSTKIRAMRHPTPGLRRPLPPAMSP
jgi:hypothetical protein